jgi:enolase
MREAFDACKQACDKAMMTTARMAEGIKMAVANSVLIKLQPDW